MANPKYKYTPELLAEAAANSLSIADVLRHLRIRWSGARTRTSAAASNTSASTSHFLGQAHSRGTWSPARRPATEILVMPPKGSS
ncbi:hypothetical protein [Microtetraspora malaysiensis]|uniref:Transposase n=1 Tax=Microtetraspora malaysiensis TaxID=161358 RepID=A0ABW6SPQ1_9ACTN